MKLFLIAVGRAGKGPEQALFDRYATRLRGALQVIEVEEKRPLAALERRNREADLLINALPKGSCWVVALDETGKDWTSPTLAQELGRRQDQGMAAAAFLIGGADGHGPAVRDRADVFLSFGRATWPHLLVRAMVAEQLYRARTILDGHPYHRA